MEKAKKEQKMGWLKDMHQIIYTMNIQHEEVKMGGEDSYDLTFQIDKKYKFLMSTLCMFLLPFKITCAKMTREL